MTHPARYSTEVLDLVGEILTQRYPDNGPGQRPIVFDPFAGTGQRLLEFGALYEFPVGGIELERVFIETPMSVVCGDARDPSLYPSKGYVIVTSPVYANGMADSHLARDESTRRNYRKAKADMTGDPTAALEPANMGNFGYRGTKRFEDGGKSIKRRLYWEIAEACVRNWDTAELVIVNVSDFSSGGVMEPHVNDWKVLLDSFGWTRQVDHPVGTRRMRHGANSDIRADHEVVIVAEKG